MLNSKSDRAFVGPHEGRELELMKAGAKPLSMFVDQVPPEYESFPEGDFDILVSEGKLVKRICMEMTKGPGGKDIRIRRILYALPEEEWRINALLLVQSLYDSLSPGWRPDLDRIIGLLLGYERDEIEKFLQLHVL
jgi:hypothetical protein